MDRSTLADSPTGRSVTIVRIDLEGAASEWLAAVGLHEGEQLIVLRRAAFHGPLHVRTGSGGEFAVAHEVARQVTVQGTELASVPDKP
jgi:ferrous iron transport protein A